MCQHEIKFFYLISNILFIIAFLILVLLKIKANVFSEMRMLQKTTLFSKDVCGDFELLYAGAELIHVSF